MTREELLEKLSNLEHEQWITWAVTLMEKEELSPERIERWKGLLVPYGELSEKYKEYDRKWARLIMDLFSLYEKEKTEEVVGKLLKEKIKNPILLLPINMSLRKGDMDPQDVGYISGIEKAIKIVKEEKE